MINELFLYDNNNGLFKEILKGSSVMNGSYHLSPNQGNDLNTSNLETFIKDPANGLIDMKSYPMCICFTPRSRTILLNGVVFEQLVFNLYFLTTTYRQNGQVKMRDKDTGKSGHYVWFDWMDMKRCADNFYSVLQQTIKTRTVTQGGVANALSMWFQVDKGNVIYNRLTKFYNDSLSGVSQSFTVTMQIDNCQQTEYSNLAAIVIPPGEIHASET